jgi:trimethylamine:corrinoid methyltransferase-like protein
MPMLFDRDAAPAVLSPEQEEVVHQQALRILEEIGIDILHDEARRLLA